MSMTAVEPTGINVAGKVSLYFVPAIANTAAPKLTEMNAVASCNISRVVYAWDPNGSQGVTERSHSGSEFAGTMLGRAKYDPAELEYDDDPQGAGVAAEYAHLGKLTWLRRLCAVRPHDVAFLDGFGLATGVVSRKRCVELRFFNLHLCRSGLGKRKHRVGALALG